MDALARAAFWGRAVETDPRDIEAGGKLAKALRELGRFDEAGAAADHVLIIEPNNLAALLESARAKIGANQGFFAIDPAQRAAAIAPRDWRPVALLAVALEQAQRDDEALATHQRALALAPGNPALMSNLGMYLATHGDAAQGEALLRRAAATPGAPAQVRQNLALILGLQGRMAEAERLARQDLPPSVVANNLAYLQAAQKADATTCAATPDLYIQFQSAQDGDTLAYAPVPCFAGQFSMDKLPNRFTRVELGVDNGDGRQFADIDSDGIAAFDLVFF